MTSFRASDLIATAPTPSQENGQGFRVRSWSLFASYGRRRRRRRRRSGVTTNAFVFFFLNGRSPSSYSCPPLKPERVLLVGNRRKAKEKGKEMWSYPMRPNSEWTQKLARGSGGLNTSNGWVWLVVTFLPHSVRSGLWIIIITYLLRLFYCRYGQS